MTVPDGVARLVSPLVDAPNASALLFDVDGTLAPIVAHPRDAKLIDGARPLLEELRGRYALLGFVSGRGLDQLERIVSVSGCGYSGNHGMEIRRPAGRLEIPEMVVAYQEAIREFAGRWPKRTLEERGIWIEDKRVSLSFHYRTALDTDQARKFLDEVVRPAARKGGLKTGWGRRILEVLPPVDITKATAVRALLAPSDLRHAIYVGDDRTDVDAWSALRDMRQVGELEHVACILAGSDETAKSVRNASDASVDGPPGVLELLELLAESTSRGAN